MKNEKEYSKSKESVDIEKVAEISDVEKVDGKKDEEVFKCDESEEIKVVEISSDVSADNGKDKVVCERDVRVKIENVEENHDVSGDGEEDEQEHDVKDKEIHDETGKVKNSDVSGDGKEDKQVPDEVDEETRKEKVSSGPSSRGDDTAASESDTTFTCTTVQSDTSGTCSTTETESQYSSEKGSDIDSSGKRRRNGNNGSRSSGNKDSNGNDDRSVRLSPDTASVNVGIDKITVVDKPSRLRSETRGQYMCQLARQFVRTNYKKVPQTPPPNQPKLTEKNPFCMNYFH